ncbi:phosphate uptake regulator PhoU [Candidatus Micrarchaeota archaeon]|nr:phosphate uptake regulator PhoU [Candidatus Micrarchaeota archaeon]
MDAPRKIQITGRNTFIVSLPHEWITKRSVNKGDAIYLNENGDGTLTLSLKQAKKGVKSCTIEVSKNAAEAAMRNIVSAYVGGAGTIVLRGQGMSTIAEEARRVLAGVEITDETGDALTLRVLSFEDINIDGIIKRAFNVTNSMFELSAAAYSEKGADVFTEISRKEDDVDRLYLLLLRTMCVEGFSSREAVFKAIAAKSIEKVGDHLLDICLDAKEAGPYPLVAGLLERSAKVYASAYRALSTNELDRGQFTEAKNEYMAYLQKAESGLKKESDKTRMLALKAVLDKSLKIIRYSEDMIESSTDMYFARMESVPDDGIRTDDGTAHEPRR